MKRSTFLKSLIGIAAAPKIVKAATDESKGGYLIDPEFEDELRSDIGYMTLDKIDYKAKFIEVCRKDTRTIKVHGINEKGEEVSEEITLYDKPITTENKYISIK